MFEIVKMNLATKEGSTKAYFSFCYNGLIVTGASLYLNKEGDFRVGMPSQKGKDGNYYSTCYFRKEDLLKLDDLLQLATNEYNNLTS